MRKSTILYVTDLYYVANQRNYSSEDLFLTSCLRKSFDLIICHPKDTQSFESMVDLVVCRNTGPVIYYQKAYDDFRTRLIENNICVYNSLAGQADMLGKQYLVDLTIQNYPVIPTIDCISNFRLLPKAEAYILKPKLGADSHGLKRVSKDEIDKIDLTGNLLQPEVDIAYEVSFYFIDNTFQYALYAPDNNKRWKLENYNYSNEDLSFAKKFIEWNKLEYGIQRVDACRTGKGEMLLVELEDLNPYLSLEDLDSNTRHTFIENFVTSLNNVIKNQRN